MVRKLAVALMGAGAFLPSVANALGLGEIELRSYLNQPLKANIELLEVQDYDSTEIRSKLASSGDFENAGIERSAQLLNLRFKVERSDDGRMQIVVSSQRPIQEPFLNFLIEVHWPAGRVLREYTILLDPPVFSEDGGPKVAVQPTVAPTPEPVRPVATPILQPEPAPVVQVDPEPQAKPEPVVQTDVPAPAPIEPAMVEPVAPEPMAAEPMSAEPMLPTPFPDAVSTATSEPMPEPSAMAPAPVEPEPMPVESSDPMMPTADWSESASATDAYVDEPTAVRTVILPTPFPDEVLKESDRYVETGGEIERPSEYGPVQRGEMLWDIAKNNKPAEDVSVQQVIVAIQRQNPESFVNDNVNLMKSGAVLRLPNEDQVRAVGQQEALNAFRQQTQEWQAYVEQQGGMASTDIDYGQIKTGLDQLTATPDGTGTGPDDRVSLVVPSDEGAGSTTTGGSGGNVDTNALMQKDTLLAQEEVDRYKLEARENRDRVRDLEQILQNQEGLINLKDEEISRLQQQLREAQERMDELEQQRSQADAMDQAIAVEQPTTDVIEQPVDALPPPEIEDPVDLNQDWSVDIDAPADNTVDAPVEMPVETPTMDAGVDPVVDDPMDMGQPDIDDTALVLDDTTVDPAELEPSVPVEVPVVDDGFDDGFVADGDTDFGEPADLGEPEPVASEDMGSDVTQAGDLEVTPIDDVSVEPTAQEPSEPVAEESFLSQYWMYLAAAAGVGIAGAGFVVMRRREDDEEYDEEEYEYDEDEDDDDSHDAIEVESTEILSEETSGFDSEETQMFGSGFTPIASEETTPLSEDPLSEADIYLAYGKYPDAIRVLSSGLVQEPNNLDYMLKLLEVYGNQEDQSTFNSYSQEVLAAHPQAQDAINELSMNHFGSAVSTGGVESEMTIPEFSSAEATPVVDPDEVAAIAEETTEVATSDDAGADDAVMDLEFDFDETGAASDSGFEGAAIEEIEAVDGADLEFDDLGDMELNSIAEEMEAESLEVEDVSLEDMSADDLAAELSSGMDVDLDMSGGGDDSLPGDTSAGLDVDLGIDGDLDSLISGDEIGTKLELAQAYMDMGSNDEAIDILNEVLEEGTDAQKTEAKALMDAMG